MEFKFSFKIDKEIVKEFFAIIKIIFWSIFL